MRIIAQLYIITTLALFCCFRMSSIAAENRYDVYQNLLIELRAGGRINIDTDKKVMMHGEGNNKVKLKGNDLKRWVDELISSPSIIQETEHFEPEQVVLFNAVRKIQQLLDYPPDLRPKFGRFYCIHLKSPDSNMQRMAFDQLRHERFIRNEFESSLDSISKKVLIDFAKKHQLYGFSDLTDNGFQNIITMVGMSGGGEEAVTFLESLAGKVPEFELSRKVALARLGVEYYIRGIVEEYENTNETGRKTQLAIALGQISTNESLKILARDLRSELVVDGVGLNQYVLAGLTLSLDWPKENARFLKIGVFDQSDFDAAEAWCVKKFGIQWEKPKPPVRPMIPRKF